MKSHAAENGWMDGWNHIRSIYREKNKNLICAFKQLYQIVLLASLQVNLLHFVETGSSLRIQPQTL